jgi:hypothetical protein
MSRVLGQCRCGQVRFSVTAAPLLTMVCHCTGCQRMTASAFSLSALYPRDRFELTSGDPVFGGLRRETRHYFCPQCMSWLYTHIQGLDQLVNVRATLLDDARSFAPFIETYTDEMLPWAHTPAVHSFKKFPPPERFPELLAEFAMRAARPDQVAPAGPG